MRFAGQLWRILVGVKDGLVLIFMLLFFGLLYAVLSAVPYAGDVDAGALVLDLEGTIVEQPADLDPIQLLSGSPVLREYRLRDVVHGLKQAAKDDRVRVVVLDLEKFVGGGRTALSEVGEALDEVRNAGKPVIAFSSYGYSDDGYQLAAHASEIWVSSFGGVLVTGPGGSNPYFKGLLDKIGITANVYKAGSYKAAVEPFIRNDMSPEARENYDAIANALWTAWLEEVKRARPKAQLQPYVTTPANRVVEADGSLAQAGLAAGLVDRIGDRNAFEKRLVELVGADDENVPGSYLKIDFDAWIAANPAGTDGGRIGVLTVAGDIVDGPAAPGTAGDETIVRNLKEGLARNDLKALVVRIDSPGGSSLASDNIRSAVMEVKAKGIPIIVSMGSVAASGGYWIATAGDHIFAEPQTITGSIGVFTILPSFEGLTQKLGVGVDGVKTTALSGEPDVLKGPSPEFDRILQSMVDAMYRNFITLVSKSRNLPVARVDEIGQGRVWDGGSARQLGLVDAFGSFDDAVKAAAELAKLDPEDVTVSYLEPEPTFLEEVLTGLFGAGESSAAVPMLNMAAPKYHVARALHDANVMLSGSSIQARCLQCPPASVAVPPRAREVSFLMLIHELMM